jgi:hypothetical protein
MALAREAGVIAIHIYVPHGRQYPQTRGGKNSIGACSLAGTQWVFASQREALAALVDNDLR